MNKEQTSFYAEKMLYKQRKFLRSLSKKKLEEHIKKESGFDGTFKTFPKPLDLDKIWPDEEKRKTKNDSKEC